VQLVKELGHDVVIITDRRFGSSPEVSQKNTYEWLAQHNIPYDELWFSADKTVVRTDMFVEDKIENYDALEKAGTDVYLINRAWNYIEGGDNRKRIPSVSVYAGIVELKTFWVARTQPPMV